MSNNFSIKQAGWLSLLSLCASTAWAHHGGGTFDATKCFAFKGTIRQLAWANPHAWLYVQVQKPDATSELWGLSSARSVVCRAQAFGPRISPSAPRSA